MMVYIKILRWVIIILLFVGCVPAQAQDVEGKIIIDIGHSSLDIRRILNDLVRELELNYYHVEFSSIISNLDPYDVLVIAAPTQPFTTEELNAIHHFVDTGGGLLLLGESGVLSSDNVEDFNVLASYYGISFQRDVVTDPQNNMVLDKAHPEIPIIENFADHEVTRNVLKIFLVSGCSLRLSKKAISLAWGGGGTYGDRLSEIYGFGGGTYEPYFEKTGNELIVLACSENRDGKVVALGDTSLFRGRSTTGAPWTKDPLEYYDHKRLALNIFTWLSVKTWNARVQIRVTQAENLIGQGKYQDALDILGEIRSLSPQIVGYSTMRDVFILQTRANQGLEADRLLEEGRRNLEDLNCEEASKNLEKAFTIYENHGNTQKIEECVSLLTICGDRGALLQKADLLFEEGNTLSGQKKYEEALEKVEGAKIIYENLGIAEKVDECNRLIKEIQNYQKKEQQTEETLQMNRLILAVILVVTAVVIVVLYIWRRLRYREEEEEEEVRPRYR
jgi:tetratricopeptide (TPR) repeat protein